MRQPFFTAVAPKRQKIDTERFLFKIKGMQTIEFELLKEMSTAANFKDACDRLLAILIRASGADFAAISKGNIQNRLFTLIASKDGTLKDTISKMGMFKADLSPERAVNNTEQLIFENSLSGVNLLICPLPTSPVGYLIRFEWRTKDASPKMNLDELPKSISHALPLLDHFEKYDSTIQQFFRFVSGPKSLMSLQQEFDECRLGRLLDRILKALATRVNADFLCVLVSNDAMMDSSTGTFVLIQDSYSGQLAKSMIGRLKTENFVTVKGRFISEIVMTKRPYISEDPKIDDLAIISSQKAHVAVPVMHSDSTLAIVIAGVKSRQMIDAATINTISELASFCSIYINKAIIHEKTKKQDSASALLIIGMPRHILEIADRYAPTKVPVLLTGETGTGKEVLARYIHLSSPRSAKEFFAINCAEITESLAESQLFGHRKGSFTGAVSDQAGAFVEADSSTLFLDEIDQLNQAVQAKLLRVIDQNEVKPIGSNIPRKIDVRLVIATNKDLLSLVKAGKFLNDLYMRISAFEIALQPLKNSKESLPNIIKSMLREIVPRYNKNITEITPRAKKLLVNYDYPGNFRELKHILENAVIKTDKNLIDVDVLPEKLLKLSPQTSSDMSYECARSDFEKEYLINLLTQTAGNVQQAAKISGLHRSYIYKLITKYEIKPESFG